MAINAIAAYGIFPHNSALPEIVRSLNQAGFDNEDICMMLPPDHPIARLPEPSDGCQNSAPC
jgi:hypothetical protein